MLESRMRRRSLSFPVNCWREDFPTASTTAHEYSGFPFSPPLRGYLKIFELLLGMIRYIWMNHRPWIFWVPFLTTSSGISKDIWTSARNDKIYIRTTAHEYLGYPWKIDKKTNSFSMWFYLRKLLISFSRSQSKGPGKSQHNCQSVKTLRFSATKLLSPKVCNTCENGNGLQIKHKNLFEA